MIEIYDVKRMLKVLKTGILRPAKYCLLNKLIDDVIYCPQYSCDITCKYYVDRCGVFKLC